MAAILIVEDNESMAKMLQQTLTGEGYKISLARDKQEGIEKIQRENIAGTE